MIDWTQVSIGVAALLVMYLLLRFAIGALVKSLTAPLQSIGHELGELGKAIARVESKIDREFDSTPVETPRAKGT